jgi:hypothetical protein
MSSTGRKMFPSFTALLRELKAGRVTEGDLTIGYFMFGCSREHALEPWNDTPNELTWFWKDAEEGRRVHAMLVKRLIAAESEGRVFWRDETMRDIRGRILKLIIDCQMEIVN